MATRSGICPTCGTEENEKNISGVTKKTQNQESLETTLPFDLQESNRRKLETPVFGLEASPEYNQTEKNQENSNEAKSEEEVVSKKGRLHEGNIKQK